MSSYIERYWRDATPEDAIKEPPMVARFWSTGDGWKNEDKLYGVDRSSKDYRWKGDGVQSEFCQVYDAPDPGEGWRLIDPDKDDYSQDGIDFWYPEGRQWCSRASVGRDKQRFTIDDLVYYRIRITPTVTYVPFRWEDREQLRGRWITWKHENGLMIESQVNHLVEFRNGDVCFKSHDAKWLLENATFLDTGKPVGKEVTQ